MRNTNKYTKLYSGGTPVFVEDNIFEIVIPTENIAGLQVGPEEADTETNKETENRIIKILETRPEISVKEMADILEISVGGVRYHINKMKKSGLLEHIGSTKKRKVDYTQINGFRDSGRRCQYESSSHFPRNRIS